MLHYSERYNAHDTKEATLGNLNYSLVGNCNHMLIFLWVHFSMCLTIHSDGTEFGSDTRVLSGVLRGLLGESVKRTPFISHSNQPSSLHRRPKRDLGLRPIK